MTDRIVLLVAIGWVMAGGGSHAQVTRDNFSVALTVTSDYVYRGLTQNDDGVALQAGFDFEHASGFFAGVWASEVDIPAVPPATEPRELEVDYYLGYRRELGASWSADLMAIRYTYPIQDPNKSYDYLELFLTAHYRDHWSIAIGHTEDVQGRDLPATSYESSLSFDLPRQLALQLGAGYWDIEEWRGDGYAYWSVGLSRPIGRFNLSLDYIDTDEVADRLFFGTAGERLVGSVTWHVF